jgi:hypothetical protein
MEKVKCTAIDIGPGINQYKIIFWGWHDRGDPGAIDARHGP